MRCAACLVASALVLLVATGAAAAEITRQGKTSRYSLTLAVGPKKTMYTQAQARARRPTSGEVTLDEHAGHGSMPVEGGVVRHLALTIRSRSTGRIVPNIGPQITLVDRSGGPSGDVVLMRMHPVGRAAAIHYGSNVRLEPRHVYDALVILGGESETLSVRAA
jgi:hypothetical protein